MYDFSLSTLRTFADLLDGFSLPSGHPQIVEAAQQIALARAELQAAVDKAQEAAAVAALTTEEATADV